MPEIGPRKKITLTQLKRYLPIKPPSCPSKLPAAITRYLILPTFSNLSITQQNIIKNKYEIAYRNYYSIEDIVDYINNFTQNKFSLSSIKRAICNSSEKYGVIDWYKFIRIVMDKAVPKNIKSLDKVEIINRIKLIFRGYLSKKKIWKGIQQVGQTKRVIDVKVLAQLSKQTLKQVKQFIQRNRVQCEQVLYKAQKQYPKTINFITLQKILNKQMDMYLDKKKVIYLYLIFDKVNIGFFKTCQLLSQLLIIKKTKAIKKQSYYLIDIEQLIQRIRGEMNLLFYSSHEMQNNFDQFYEKKMKDKGMLVNYEDQLDEQIFYDYISQKCQRRYSRYMLNKFHKKIQFRTNIHYLFNKPNIMQLTKLVQNMINKRNKKRMLKQQNPIYYSYRTIILNLITRCKLPKLTRQKLAQLFLDNPQLCYKSFFCVWRVYPQVINVDRIKKQCKLHPLACYYKLRRTQEQYEKMYEYMLQLLPEGQLIAYQKLQQKINMNLQFVLDITKIKVLNQDRYDQVNYREAIKDIFQPDFQLDIRAYIHRKVSEKTYALWKSYKLRKQLKQKAQKIFNKFITALVPNPKSSIQSSKKMKTQKSKSSLKSKKEIAYNPQSLQIVQYNLNRLLYQLPLTNKQVRKQFHKDEHIRHYLSINKRQQYQYRTLTPRYVLHPIPGIIGMGSQLMFLNKNKIQIIKLKYFYKPGIQIIDFTTFGNDVIILTSYFTLQFYSLAQQSNYSYKTIQLLSNLKSINFTDLDNICQDRIYSKFPIFLRSTDTSLLINTTIISNKIYIIHPQNITQIKQISFTQIQHILNINSIKIIDIINKSNNKYQICNNIVKQLSEDDVSLYRIYKIINKIIEDLENYRQKQNVYVGSIDKKQDEIIKISQSEVKGFIKNMSQYSSEIINCILKQQLKLTKQHKIPDVLTQVINSLIKYMSTHNLSVQQIINTIDKQHEQFLKTKALKDYLLKITQQVYINNQKQIDIIIKNMTVGKNIRYDTFCQILQVSGWMYKIWEKPLLVLRDYLVVEDCGLILYTIEGDWNVWVKNINDGVIVANLGGHNCTPTIHFIQQSYVLMTGDNHTIRVWRIYEDLIKKYDQNPPWEITPFKVIPNAHDSLITSISYLNRSHHIVTTSLDSTTKFWSFNLTQESQIKSEPSSQQKLDTDKKQKIKHKPYLQQIKRIYSNQCVYINSKSINIILDNDGCRLELLGLAKIQKQINQNNKYKYQMKIQVFQVQDMIIKTGPNNIYLELPPKLKNILQNYAESIGVKKNILLAKTINSYQNQTMKKNLISQNLQRTLYQSVKNCFIFQQFDQIYNICQYLVRKNIGSQIVRILFEKFGVGIPKPNQFATINAHKQILIKPAQICMFTEDPVQISEDEIQLITNKLKSISKGKNITVQQALNVLAGFLNIINYQKAQKNIQQYLKRFSHQKQFIEIDFIIDMFKPLRLDSELDRLYAILRSVNILLKQKGIKIWNIFTVNKLQLQKRKKISQNQFEKFMFNLGLPQSKIKLLVSFMTRHKNISLDDYVYYTKLAWQSVGFQLNQSSYSKIFMRNSRLLESKLQLFKLDSGIQIQKQQFQQKAKNLQTSFLPSISDSRSSLMSRKSSKKGIRQSQAISEQNSNQKDSNQKKRILSKSQSPNKQEISNSVPISSSNSRVSLSHQSQAKDEYTRQILSKVKKINQMMKNEGKSIWDITSLSMPQFMDNNLITQQEYFNILSGIRSPIKLSDKLKIMSYIMKQSNQYSAIDLNILFELFSTPLPIQRRGSKTNIIHSLAGQKYIISCIVSRISQTNSFTQHLLSQHVFSQKQQLTIQQLLLKLSQKPFKLLNFCLKQLQQLLILKNKSAFNLQQIKTIIQQGIRKYNIKVQTKQFTLIQQIIHQIDNRGVKLQQLIPKSMTNNGIINYNTFNNIISNFFHEKSIIIQNQFIKIIMFIQQQRLNQQKQKQKTGEINPRFSKLKTSQKKAIKINKQLTQKQMLKQSQFKYRQLLNYINKMIQLIKKSTNHQKDGVKKFLKALDNKKITLLSFFLSLDRNRNYYINEIQFVAGLAELKVQDNFWVSIKKKNSKKLYYFQLINYLVTNQFVNYKCVDSELQAAMNKFVKRFIRNDDIQAVFDRLRAKDTTQSYNATFLSFQSALKMGNLFKQHQISYLFGAFANAQNLKSSNLSNDSLIKDATNMHKTFNFKMFTDVVRTYENSKITKSPHYKLYNYFKKRNISILNQFIKWMQRNKKIKQINEAIKLKQYTLPRQLYIQFIKQLNTQLQQKQIKQLLFTFGNPLQFANFNQKLQQIYKKGNSNIENQQIIAYLQQIYKKIKKINVTVNRLFIDFSHHKYQMNINQFTYLIQFLELGLTKIQNKLIFNSIDLEKKGYITLNQLQNVLEQAIENMDKQQDQYQLDYIIQKLIANKDKYILKSSRITYNLDRAFIIFNTVLTNQQIIKLYKNAQQYYKTTQITQKNMQQFLIDKQKQGKAKKDKKYKQLIINFLKFVKKNNLQVVESYYYFSQDTGVLNKNKFLLIYQSLGLKSNIIQINSLYSYFDQSKTGVITLQKWQDKLNIIQYQKQNNQVVSGQQLQVFYKVKLILADIYLLFVRKLYKSKQIGAYFDINNNGQITYQQFLQSIQRLGLHLDQSVQQKLTNYLDKQRNNLISISNIVYQLQNCLGSKTKLILQTKTSCIFKQKIHLIQQKQNYFIQRLVNFQHFLQANQKLESVILVTDFIDVIKDFGIVLGQDQFTDVERNFKFNKDNLKLYPLYFMFINIFKTYENSLPSDQIQRFRYQKLFQSIIKNGLTMKIFHNIPTAKEANIFLSQLKIFTPIQVKLMIQSVTFHGSNFIDSELLIRKTRDSFLKTGQLLNKTMMFDFGVQRKDIMKEWLCEQMDPKRVTQILRANTGKINKDTFETLLNKLNIVLKKADVAQLFNILGRGEDFVLIEQLISTQEKIKIQQLKVNQQQKNVHIMLDHICKSLDFKGVSLDEAWEKYFTNIGFINFESFQLFLNEIGFDFKVKQYQKVVPQFIAQYRKQFKLYELKASQIETIMKKMGHIPQKQCIRAKYFFQSEAIQKFSQILRSSQQFIEGFERFIQAHGLNANRIISNTIYTYIKYFINKNLPKSINHINQKQIIFFTNLILKKEQTNINQFLISVKTFLRNYSIQKYRRHSLKTEIDEAILLNDPSSSSLQKSSHIKLHDLEFQQTIKKICQQNFIQSYKNIIAHFQQQISKLNVPMENYYRLSLNLTVQKLLQNDFLLFIKPKLLNNKTTKSDKHKKAHYAQHSMKFNMKTVPNLIIQKQQYLTEQGIYIINQKYYAMNISQKKDFELFAVVSHLLDQHQVFLRAKNYYLWQPNDSQLPKQAINFRWKFIPIYLLKICKQFEFLEEHGYALPHLRWNHLHSLQGINRATFPSHADGTGRIPHISHQKLFKLEDSYCPPEIYRKKQHITLKLNTWILGCIIYQFVWGHSPNSFILLLLEYIQSRHSQFQLAQVLRMQQLPSDFRYTPFNFLKIKQVLAFDHELKAQGIPDDLQNNITFFGLRGLIKTLQIFYGSQEMYYRKQFQIFEKLHQIILLCLDPNPDTRPTTKNVLQKLTKLMQEQDIKQFQYSEYIEVLKTQQSNIKLNKQLIDPLKILLLNKIQFTNIFQLQNLSQLFYKLIQKISKNSSIKQLYTIPKRYPWPDKQTQQIYEKQLLQHKMLIRSHQNYSTICLIMNQNCMEMLINLYVLVRNRQDQNMQQKILGNVYNNIIKSLYLIFEMLRDYNNPFSGYVNNILQAYIQLYYRQSFCFTSDTTQDPRKGQSQGLKIITTNKTQQKNALKIIKNIIYLDGSANIQYLPIYHFLITNKRYQLLFQYFYASVDLNIDNVRDENVDRRILAVTYFRDRIYDQYFWEIVKYLKIDVLMLKLLDCEELTTKVLLFYKDFTMCNKCQQHALVYSNIFYLKIGIILAKNLTPLEDKKTIIQISTNILKLNNKKLIKKMNQPAFGLLRQIFKLLVQPIRDTAIHQQFIKLYPILKQFISMLKNVDNYYKIIQQIQGVETILNAFENIKIQENQDQA